MNPWLYVGKVPDDPDLEVLVTVWPDGTATIASREPLVSSWGRQRPMEDRTEPERDYERDEYVEIVVDDGSWIPAQVVAVGPTYVSVEYQHDAPNGPYSTSLTRSSIRRRGEVKT
jgi:hypothetical protein